MVFDYVLNVRVLISGLKVQALWEQVANGQEHHPFGPTNALITIQSTYYEDYVQGTY